MTNRPVINVLIADDHQMFIDGVELVLNETTHIKVAATCNNGRQVLDYLKLNTVDIALIDLEMPEINGPELARHMAVHYPAIKVIVLSMHSQAAYIVKMVQAGAKGYLLKSVGKTELLKAIELVNKGGVYYSSEVAINLTTKIFKEGMSSVVTPDKLTEREAGIIKLLVKGLSNKQMADKLCLSEATVKTHRQRILVKLKLTTTADLINYAHSNNLVDKVI